MQHFIIGSKTTSIFPSTKPEAPIIYLNIFSDEGQKVYETAQDTVWPLFTLVSISDLDWNHDMSPWNSPPAFKNVEPCTGGAVDYLRYEREDYPNGKEGYWQSSSLAWGRRVLAGRIVRSILHLLRTVQENTEAILAYYHSKEIDTVFQSNQGNHFLQSVERTTAGIAWMLSR